MTLIFRKILIIFVVDYFVIQILYYMKTEYKAPSCNAFSEELKLPLCLSNYGVTTEDYIISGPEDEIKW